MWTGIKKMFSFHLADIVGLIVGWVLISSATNTELFYLVMAPQLYVIMFLVVFLFHSWVWLFAYHGESAYTKQMLGKGFKDFLRVAIACVSAIGIYFFLRSFS